GADHGQRGQQEVEEPVAAGVENQQPEKQRRIAVAVDDGIEKASEAGDLVREAGDTAVYQVEKSRSDDDQAGIEKHAALVVAVGVSKQKRGIGVDQQPHQGQDVGIDVRESEQAHDGVEQNATRTSDSAGPAHRIQPLKVFLVAWRLILLPVPVPAALPVPPRAWLRRCRAWWRASGSPFRGYRRV